MDYFSLMIKKELLLANIVNNVVRFIEFFQFENKRILNKCLEKERMRLLGNGASLILNAPSINNQNLMKLKGTDIVFVNRGFKHPLYRELHPKYHIFCDPKFKKGIWPLSWVDEITEMVPDITFVMPVEWRTDARIFELSKKVNICWIRLKYKSFSPFVAGYTLSFLLDLGYNRINVTGWEANGLGHELIKDVSHFYGKNEENGVKGSTEYIIDFYMYMLSYSYYKSLSFMAKNKGVTITNMTYGGAIDMFERNDMLNEKVEIV